MLTTQLHTKANTRQKNTGQINLISYWKKIGVQKNFRNRASHCCSQLRYGVDRYNKIYSCRRFLYHVFSPFFIVEKHSNNTKNSKIRQYWL